MNRMMLRIGMICFLKAIPVFYSSVQSFPPEYFRQEIMLYLR